METPQNTETNERQQQTLVRDSVADMTKAEFTTLLATQQETLKDLIKTLLCPMEKQLWGFTGNTKLEALTESTTMTNLQTQAREEELPRLTAENEK